MTYIATWIIPLAIAKTYYTLTHNTPTTIILTLATTIAMLYGYNHYIKTRTTRKN